MPASISVTWPLFLGVKAIAGQTRSPTVEFCGPEISNPEQQKKTPFGSLKFSLENSTLLSCGTCRAGCTKVVGPGSMEIVWGIRQSVSTGGARELKGRRRQAAPLRTTSSRARKLLLNCEVRIRERSRTAQP